MKRSLNPANILRQWPADVSICIPAYKAAHSLSLLLPDLRKTVPENRILIIDDASNDETPEIARKNDVRCIIHEQNTGKGGALKTGFSSLLKENTSWIITMDADGQHSVADVPRFLETMTLHPDAGMLLGARDMSIEKMPLLRIFSNRTTSAFISKICGRNIQDSQCGFRAYSSKLLSILPIKYNRFEMESEIIIRACALGFSIHSVPIQTLYCSTTSHMSNVMDTHRWIRAVWRIQKECGKKKMQNAK